MGAIQLRLRETSWAAVAGVLQSLGPFGAFWIVARLAPPDELGRYALAVAIASPVFLVLRMQLRQASVADPAGETVFASYCRLRLLSATSALAVVSLVAAVALPLAAAILVGYGLVRWAEDIGDIYYAPLQRNGRWERIAAFHLVRVVGTLACIWFGWDLLGLPASLVAVAIWNCGVTVVVAYSLGTSTALASSVGGGVRTLLRSNWSLGGTAAVISLLTYTPRYGLAWSNGAVAVGDLAALNQVALVGNIVLQSAGQASLARLGVKFIQDRQQFRRLVWELLGVAAVLSVVGIVGALLWGELVLVTLFQPRFGSLSLSLVAMMGGSFFVYVSSVCGYALTAAGIKGAQLVIFGMALLVGLTTAFPLSLLYGLNGAVASGIAGWAVAAALSSLTLWRIAGSSQEAVIPQRGTLERGLGGGRAV